MKFMTTAELQDHHRHLRDSLIQLDRHAPDWSAEDRARGETTRRNLKREIARVEADLHMAGAMKRQAAA